MRSHRSPFAPVFLAFTTVLFLAACGGGEQATTVAPASTEAPAATTPSVTTPAAEPTAVPPTTAPEPQATVAPTTAPDGLLQELQARYQWLPAGNLTRPRLTPHVSGS